MAQDEKKLPEEIEDFKQQIKEEPCPRAVNPELTILPETWAERAALGTNAAPAIERKSRATPAQAELYCTVEAVTQVGATGHPEDVRRGLINCLREGYKDEGWKPAALKRDQRDPRWVEIMCTTQKGQGDFKLAMEKVKPAGPAS